MDLDFVKLFVIIVALSAIVNIAIPEKQTKYEDIDVLVKTFMVHRICECGGEMKSRASIAHMILGVSRYKHKCNKCGKTERYKSIFPKIKYEE